jgi:glycerol-3-phosphate dehydrogenase
MSVRFGLWLYSRFASRRPLRNASNDRRRLEQLLDNGQRWSVFAYEDAQCEYPERLVIEWLVQAASLGAVVRNYTEALEVQHSNGVVTGVRLRDRVSDDESFVSCDWVVNATGPWADFVCRRSNIETDEPLIGGVRGAHILLPMFSGAPQAAVYTEALDRRPFFVVPWAGQLLVGTTEVNDNRDPSEARASADEISYLLKSFQRLFPGAGVGFDDIRGAFAGIRPLPYVTERTPNSVTRRHFLVDHADHGARHMISVIGGKLTTAASLARECARAIGLDVPEPKGYAIAGNGNEHLQLEAPMQEQTGIKQASLAAIESLFGPAAPLVLNLVQRNADLSEPICPHTDHLVGEAVYAAQNEFAITLGDILLRRVPLALSSCWSDECRKTAAARIGKALNWSTQEIARQTVCFQDEYARFLERPSR